MLFKNSKIGIKSESGYTLVEQMVAIAILLSVLLPASTFFIYMNKQLTIKDKVQARSFAQNELELTLLHKTYSPETKKVGTKEWLLKKSISHDNNLVKIQIEIWESDRLERRLIKLKTIRYVAE